MTFFSHFYRNLSRFLTYICLVTVIALIILSILSWKADNKAAYYFSSWNSFILNNLKSETNQLSSPTISYNPSYSLELFQQDEQIQNVTSRAGLDINRLILLAAFQNLLTFLGIKAVVIEPAILFNILDSRHQNLLTKQKYNASDFQGSNGVLTYGMFEDDIQRLQSDSSVKKMQEIGFEPCFIKEPIADWMRAQQNELRKDVYTSHACILYFDLIVHVVVFYKRNNYLWYAGFDSQLDIFPKTKWLFANGAGAFEKFYPVPSEIKFPPFPNFNIPSDPQLFLFQMVSSRFLECSSNKTANYSYLDPADRSEMRGSWSTRRFNYRTVSAIRNIKHILHPLLMNVFIFSGTLLGWYRDCGVIPYTQDVDFAAWADEIDDVDVIIKNGMKNKGLPLTDRWGLPEEALELRFSSQSLRIDLFFHYKIEYGSWVSGHLHSRGFYVRYYYPHFTLCSTDLLGEKVLLPCETETIIRTEYGRNWRTPISGWNYLSSPKNKGQRIYWDEKRLNITYEGY